MPSLVTNKCCGCVDLKTGSFIVGYLNLVGCLIMNVVAGINLDASVETMICTTENELFIFFAITLLVLSVVVLILTVLAFAFALVLLVGLHKSKPGYLKAYLVYNVIFVAMLAMMALIKYIDIYFIGYWDSTEDIVLPILIVGLHSFYLVVIRSMYFFVKDLSKDLFLSPLLLDES